MPDRTSINDFGLLIAFALPGFSALWGTHVYVTGHLLWPWEWDATVGGFLYSSVVAVTAGLAVSTVRWLVIDAVHHHTGIRPPVWDFARLHDRTEAFRVLLDGHYRYYQHYANMAVSLAWVLAARHAGEVGWLRWDATDGALLAGIGLYFLGSRDTLRKYYARAGDLLGARRTGGVRRRVSR